MQLREMRRLFKVVFLMICPFFLNGQINGFQSVVNNPWLDSFSAQTTSSFIDTSRGITIGPRFFGISSFSENRQYDSYLLGLSVSSRINKNRFGKTRGWKSWRQPLNKIGKKT